MTTTTDAIGYGRELTLAMHVSDYERSKAWYREVLGFELLYEMPEMGWGELQSSIPGVNVGLSQVESVEPKRACVPVFAVEDIDRARTHLESKSVRFDGETQTIPGLVRLATFFDPDGNAFMLSQSLAAHAEA